MGSGIRGRGAVTLRGLVEIRNKDGSLRRYLRRNGEIVAKLPGDVPLDSDEFQAAWGAAVDALPKPKAAPGPGSIAHLVASALRTDRVKGWSPVYRAKIRRHLDAIRAAHGALPARGAQERHIQADADAAADSVGRLKAWRFLMDHGRRTGLVDRDPAQGVRIDQKPGDGFLPWEVDQIAAYRARWPYGTPQRAAMELLFWTGCRVSDVVLIGPQHVGRDGVLSFRQGKTGSASFVPWTCAMPPFADLDDLTHLRAALAAMPGGQMTFLATAQGRTRSHKSLGHLIARAADAAGFDRSAHGLRKSRLASLAERGATTHQIMSWGGHLSVSEVEHYTRSAARRAAVMGTEQARNVATLPNPGCNAAEKR